MPTNELKQTPSPGENMVLSRGNILSFQLRAPAGWKGSAFLRTNLNDAPARRTDVIRHVENDQPRLARDWHDHPMHSQGHGVFTCNIPLLDSGCFEAKCFFLPAGSNEPAWPEGRNTLIKVEPAEFYCANQIYSAFVRLFRSDDQTKRQENENLSHLLDSRGYSAIPASGTFRDLVRKLDFIIGKLGFRIIQLLPVHPTPTTYARMGRYGSPFAVLDFMDVDPALAEFDRKTTPLEQFQELIDAVHARQGCIFMDIPINHTGWASSLQIHKPHWFARDLRAGFQSPGAWGVTWGDLSQLDYKQQNKDLWTYMAEVFLFWCKKGVDGFRCDAGYMIPAEVWEYIVAKVRTEFPDVIFLLENLGGRKEITEDLLSRVNLNWAYSELFQDMDRATVESHLADYDRITSSKGLLVHFAETHDNNRLASRSIRHARLRTAMAALFSHAGGFGITCGLEWLAKERINVHSFSSLEWDNPINQVDHVTRLNAILNLHPSFLPGSQTSVIPQQTWECIAHLRCAPSGKRLLTVANLSQEKVGIASWPTELFPLDGKPVVDLLSGRTIVPDIHGNRSTCELKVEEILCLCSDEQFPARLQSISLAHPVEPPVITRQRHYAKLLELLVWAGAFAGKSSSDLEKLLALLVNDPTGFCASLAGPDQPPPVVSWNWPSDLRRIVPVPDCWLLHIKCPYPFLAEIQGHGTVLRHEHSFTAGDGHSAILLPPDSVSCRQVTRLVLTVYAPDKAEHTETPILFLSPARLDEVQTSFSRAEVIDHNLKGLCTNGTGAMSLVHAAWGHITSQYDSMLAANLHPEYPVNRQILLTRCRAWLVHRGFSQDINVHCLFRFQQKAENVLEWDFNIPCGQGKLVPLRIVLTLIHDRNTVTLRFIRSPAREEKALADDIPVRVIVRPDIEDRSFHEKTKAFTGPEQAWRAAISPSQSGFRFAPSHDHVLNFTAEPGVFKPEPEWLYMVPHPEDADRGLDGSSDLFSPGYFTFDLTGAGEATLVADANDTKLTPLPAKVGTIAHVPPHLPLWQTLLSSTHQYLARRNNGLTVIAGFPWFLDWGRDTLICLRGIIAAGMLEEARKILKEFARFEENGTLPNMIHGDNADNRDTSDAPLWFFVACQDLIRIEDSASFLDEPCGKRTIRQILVSMADSIISGTHNGIRMDPASGLVFSPAHFTWMDTRFPAGTPREGYPIEIQALWFSALQTLTHFDPKPLWKELAKQVSTSIRSLFLRPNCVWLSDCLHATPGMPAARATADDALRPNQLLAVTLGAVTDKVLMRGIVAACSELLVPGAIRSLADRPVTFPLPVDHNGQRLNDPLHPYWGTYQGDEDTRRKPAYHNGTAWTWLFPSYSEAMAIAYGTSAKDAALSLMSGSVNLINNGCAMQVPELLDGNSPHIQRGCCAQAWGVSELYRVLAVLDKM